MRRAAAVSPRYHRAMAAEHVALTYGSRRSSACELDGLRVTEAWFPPRLVLPSHFHERASVAVILEGGFDGTVGGATHDCPRSTVLVEPAGERHANRFAPTGAHVLVVQPDPEARELLRPCARLLDAVEHFSHPGLAGVAWRIADELRHPDGLSPLVVEGLALDLLATAARRAATPPRRTPAEPSWLARVEELLHARFRERLRLGEIARTVGIHPVHLARVFRAHRRLSVGGYLRGLRLDWAAEQLAATDETISAIALAAEFADQSHFTRAFKRHSGQTPAQFRRQRHSSPSK
jgi:AraC family transcriptional regulator